MINVELISLNYVKIDILNKLIPNDFYYKRCFIQNTKKIAKLGPNILKVAAELQSSSMLSNIETL